MKNFLTINDCSVAELQELLQLSSDLKKQFERDIQLRTAVMMLKLMQLQPKKLAA